MSGEWEPLTTLSAKLSYTSRPTGSESGVQSL